MLKKVREFKEALKEFRRSAGQVKRWHPSINPEEILGDAHTKFQVNKALDKMKRMAEMENIEKRVAEYERRTANQLEEWEKQWDIKIQKRIHYKAWRKFKQNREGLKWTRADYDLFWDTFGSPDIVSFYGSDQIVETGTRILALNKEGYLKPTEIAELAKKIATESQNSDEIVTVEQAVDKLYAEVVYEIDKRRAEAEKEVGL